MKASSFYYLPSLIFFNVYCTVLPFIHFFFFLLTNERFIRNIPTSNVNFKTILLSFFPYGENMISVGVLFVELFLYNQKQMIVY